MSTYARIQNGVVAELFTPPDGVSLASCFVPSVVATFVPAPDNVRQDWTYSGGDFNPPVATPPTPPSTTIGFVQFLNRFTTNERNALMTAARSDDSIFLWLIMGAGTHTVDIVDPEVDQDMQMLVGAGIITEQRCIEILTP